MTTNTITLTNDFGEKMTLNVGDWVEFKSDIEQVGTIKRIVKGSYGGARLILVNEDGFDGGYIGGDTETTIDAASCTPA